MTCPHVEGYEPDTMSRADFNALLEYSTSLPTGTTIGKKWKRQCPHGTWVTGEYVPDPEPKMVGIKWRRVVVVMSDDELAEIKARASKAYLARGWRDAMNDVGALADEVDRLRGDAAHWKGERERVKAERDGAERNFIAAMGERDVALYLLYYFDPEGSVYYCRACGAGQGTNDLSAIKHHHKSNCPLRVDLEARSRPPALIVPHGPLGCTCGANCCEIACHAHDCLARDTMNNPSSTVPIGRCEGCGTPFYTRLGYCGVCKPGGPR